MPIHIYNAKQQRITLEDTPFASGGEGNIHRIIAPATYQNCCVKLYFDQYRTPQKEQKTIFQATNPPPNLANTNFIVCWPQEVVYQNQHFAGFVMPLAYANSQQLYALCLPNISPTANTTLRQKYDRTTPQGMVNRFKLCVNIASAIHLIHATQQYVLVDLKPQNILFTHDGKIAVTDIDSVQISQTPRNVLHHAAVATPEYTPTEGHTGILNPAQHYIPQSWDDFSLAVLFYELLMGLHPYTATFGGAYNNQNTIAEKIQNGLFVHGSKASYATAIPRPHQYYAQLPAALQSLFYAAFETGHSYPQQRPTAHQWGDTLYNTLQNTQHIQQHTQTVPQPNVKVVTPPIQPVQTVTNLPPPNVFVQPAPPPSRITLLNARTINFGLGTIHTRPITLPRPQISLARYKGIAIIAFLVLLAWLLKDPVSNYFVERARVQAEAAKGVNPNTPTSTNNNSNNTSGGAVDAVQGKATSDYDSGLDPNLPKTEIRFFEYEYDFGTINEGEIVSHTFKFTNTGREPLIIWSATGSCGCVTSDFTKDPVAPRAMGEIKVNFDTKGKSGEQTKTITIVANTQPSPIRLTIKANCIKNNESQNNISNSKPVNSESAAKRTVSTTPIPAPASTNSDPFANQMVHIEGGTFMMGSNNSGDDEVRVYKVTVSDFYIGKYEVTQAQWRAIMGNNNLGRFRDCDLCPAENVSWGDVQEFIKKLNAQTGKIYRLPTDAEWEYAARGGQTYAYAGSNNLDEVAWHSEKNEQAHPVGQKKANGYGLYDMSGNINEWCIDSYDPIINKYCIIRGGAWYSDKDCRVFSSHYRHCNERSVGIGFRLAR